MAAALAYDLIVIGGGSGGVAAARRAAGHGARVAVVEMGALGGTCVNVGCVPKKLMYTAAGLLSEVQHAAVHAGVRAGGGAGAEALTRATMDLPALKAARDAYVQRLATVSYPGHLAASGVAVHRGRAAFLDARTVRVEAAEPAQLTAPHILIAVGGVPRKLAVPGGELAITSDGVFDLAAIPPRVTVVGAGYIAVEMAGILHALGSAVTLLAREAGCAHPVLRGFDETMRAAVAGEMRRAGIAIVGGAVPARIERRADGLAVLGAGGEPLAPPADVVLQAVGREPNLRGLNLEAVGVAVDARGRVAVDELQNCSAAGVYAVGDAASNGFELTPVAIAAGRLLADRLFGGPAFARARVAYDARSIPTVVFTHPPLGTVGLTEAAARAAHGDAAVKVYRAAFAPMLRAFQPAADVCKTTMKVVVVGPEETVVGLHVHGDGADEMLQGFAVAVQARLTMRDFNSRCAAGGEAPRAHPVPSPNLPRAASRPPPMPRSPSSSPLSSAWPFTQPPRKSSLRLSHGSRPTARLTTD